MVYDTYNYNIFENGDVPIGKTWDFMGMIVDLWIVMIG